MKAKFSFLFLIALTAFFISSCQEDNTVTPSSTSCSYAPYSNGSEFVFVYSDTSGSGNSDTSTTVVIGDTVINGATCKMLSQNSGPAATAYHHCGGGEYMYLNIYIPQYNTIVDTLVYMKDNLNVGDTWTVNFLGTFNTIPINAEYEYSCVATGLTRTVNGQSFSNVVHIRNNVYIVTLGIRQMIATTDSYFAEGVGAIESSLGGLSSKLLSYNIVP